VNPEPELAARVLDALLRENYGGLGTRVGAGPVLGLPGPGGRLVELRRDGFLQDLAVRRPATLRLSEVLDALARVADPADAAGVAAFTRECRETLATLRLHAHHQDAVMARLGEGAAPLGTTTWYDTLAAYADHPVYPTSRCRLGLTSRDLRRYAPEFHPTFPLAWAALPRETLVLAGELPGWWPGPSDLGLPSWLAGTHVLIPVHPLTVRMLQEAAPRAVVARRRRLTVSPTLSMRTLAVRDHPDVHVKLPLPTSTLGLRNRRSLVPRTLADAALVERTVSSILTREPHLREAVLVADEGTYGHAHHEYAAFLVRRFPAVALDRARVVPVAALLAQAPSGQLVIEELSGGDVMSFLDAYLRVLFDWHVTLFVRYGMALEAHQQNTSLVLDGGRPRLLLKDHDGALIHHGWLAAALGRAAPAAAAFQDARMLTDDPGALIAVFVTITVHLCAGALAFGLAGRGIAPLGELLGLVRGALERSLAWHAGSPRAELLRARVLDAERLPGKSMVIAGTLVDKARTGARDINKHYGTDGPNYLGTAWS
jgi:siderophore synthetase component